MSSAEAPAVWSFLRPVLFALDPELVHEAGLAALSLASRLPALSRRMSGGSVPEHPLLASSLFGLPLRNPLGIAAGFDKDARAVPALAELGFAAVEVGTVTPRPQRGNDRPRLFRIPEARSLVNRLGFPSAGVVRVAERLRSLPPSACIVGVNLGKNRDTDAARAADDYAAAARATRTLGHHVVLNVSSPNTPGLRDLQAPALLRTLVEAVVAAEHEAPGARPVLVKLSPDLADEDVDAALDASLAAGAVGVIAANTTTTRPGSIAKSPVAAERGGLSGPPLLTRTVALVRRIRARTEGRLPIVAAGGVSDAAGAWTLVRAGATLVQAYTGFVYGGPAWPRLVVQGLLERLEAAGVRSIDDVRGSDD